MFLEDFDGCIGGLAYALVGACAGVELDGAESGHTLVLSLDEGLNGVLESWGG